MVIERRTLNFAWTDLNVIAPFLRLPPVNPEAVNLTYEPAINEVKVPILPRDVCNDWIDTANVTEGMICAGYPEGGKDACQVSSLPSTNHYNPT